MRQKYSAYMLGIELRSRTSKYHRETALRPHSSYL
jgi:hypothetical protein